MKGQIKRVLAILFAVLFVVTLTASAVSAEELATLMPLEVSDYKAASLTSLAFSDDDWCGNGHHCCCPWCPWWWPHPPHPWPPEPDPWWSDDQYLELEDQYLEFDNQNIEFDDSISENFGEEIKSGNVLGI